MRALRALLEASLTDTIGRDSMVCFADRPHEDGEQKEKTKQVTIEYAHFGIAKRTGECVDVT